MCRGEGQREKERISSRLPTECRAWYSTLSHDPEIMTQAKIKSRMLNWLSHPGTPLFIYFSERERDYASWEGQRERESSSRPPRCPPLIRKFKEKLHWGTWVAHSVVSDSWFWLRSWSQGCDIEPSVGSCLGFSLSFSLYTLPTHVLSLRKRKRKENFTESGDVM